MSKSAKLKISYALFHIQSGWISIAATSKGLLAVVLPKDSKNKAKDELKNNIGKNFSSSVLIQDQKILTKYIEELSDYFNGRKIEFNYTLDLRLYTCFQCQVYSVVRTIPYGKTASYSWVAQKIGSPGASRAVGQALKRNLLPIVIPCHRVIKSDNELCGFSSDGEWKARLLAGEGAILT